MQRFSSFLLNSICLMAISGGVLAQSKPANDPTYTYKAASTDGTGKFYKGREIAQVMGFEGAAWLERNTREQEENTRMAIAKLPITHGSVVADIGAGTGYYTFQIATKVPQGKVYAVEIQQPAIDYLVKRGKELKLNNIVVVKGGEKSPNLPDNSIALALMVDVYHELLYPQEMLQAINKALKPHGQLLLLEYRAEDPAIDIKPLHKTSIIQLNKELKANGFHLKKDGEFMPIQHFLLYEKN
jgi:ubiquinone/menaquinone biosynthesis C-methylase UbiE